MNLLLAFVLTAAVLTSGSVVKPPGENFELLILHNNDMHARFEQTSQLSGACTTADREAGKCYGGFPRVAHVVKEARRAAQTGEGPPVLYLNAGDTYTGTAWFTIYKWKIAAEFINALQPDAVSLGNHEFDNGVSGLTPFIEALTCPVLAANLNLALVPELLVERNLMNSVVFDINGTRVGVIGYLTPDTQFLAIKNDLKYIEEVTAVKKEAAKLKKQGVNILIALGHSGFTKDLEIAKEVDDIDLVIGGHTNTFLWNGTSPDVEKPEGPYPTLVKQKSGRLVPAVQAYAYTKYLGKLHLVFDSEGEMIDANGNPILLDSSVNQDLEVLQIVNRYRVDIRNITDHVTGITPVILDGTSCRLRECNMGNLITDAMVEKYAKDYKGKGWTDAPVAIIQGGGIRASIAPSVLPANITKGDLLRVMPFDGNLVKLSISGRDLMKMLEHAVALYNPKRPPGPFLQMSGMKVEYDFRKPPGYRVLKVSIRCGECLNPQFSILNVTEMYNILMPAFLSMGGDGYVIFEGMPSKALPYDELESAIEYIGARSAVHPSVEGRIILNHLEQLQFNSGFYPKLSLPCLGNHEFDEAVDGVVPFIRNLSSPVLAANLILDKVPSLQNEQNLYKSIIVEKNNVKIGIIGYLTPETKYLAPVNDVEYEDEVVAIRREVKKLKKENVNILIALGHSGFVKDTIIAKEVEDLDLVIGGHSNTFLWNSNSTTESPEIPEGPYPTEIQQPNGRTVRVVQAYAYTKYMGKLHLIFDSEGEIIKCDGTPILLNQRIPRDPELLQTINKYRNDVDRINNEVVGQSSVFLDGTCRLRECNLGDLITDAILNYTRENFHYQYQDVTIVLIQGGRIRASIIHSGKPFVMTRGDWINVLPFSDTLCIVTMTGKTLKQSLEHSVSTWRTVDSTGQFQQFSGMEVAYDLSQPVGSRVVIAKAVCTNCSKDTKLDIKDIYEYKMMMPSFIADGGDGYTMFKDLPRETLTFNELDSVLYYVKKYSPVEPQLDGRIKVLNEDKVKNGESSKPSRGIVIQSNLKLYFAVILLTWFKFLFL